MIVLPVVARELSVQARRRSTYWIRVAASAVAGFLTLWLLVVSAASIPMISQGRTLFSILSILAFGYCLLIGVLVTADSLSAEKREGTIGLLFLTDLKGYDVILGKMLSSSLHAVFGLFAVVPMMSLALLFGGVTVGEIARTALVLGNTLFFSLSAGMFVSTISRNERKSVFAGLLFILLITAGPYEVAFYNYIRGTASGLDEAVLSPSPAFAFSLAKSSATGLPPTPVFWRSLAQIHALAWALLASSCVIVPHVWKDRPKGKRQERWSQSWRRLRFGNEDKRTAFRHRLLARNPCLWLSSRERYRPVAVWFLIVTLSAIGVWIYLHYRIAFYESSLFLVFTIHVLLKIWFTSETCHRWIEDRRSGALELLLCAPLRVEELVRGQDMALNRQFGWPIAATFGLSLLAWAGITEATGDGWYSQPGRTWLLISLPVLAADFAALRWVGAWLGLTARGFNESIVGTLARVLWFRWFAYAFIVAASFVWAWIGFRPLPPLSSPSSWFVLALVLDFVFGWTARRRFLRFVRVIAANPSNWKSAVAESAVRDQQENRVPEDAPTALTPGQARRWNPKIKWAVLSVALVLMGTGSYRYWLKREVETRLKAVQKAGFPISIEELNRARPPLANSVNAAEVLEQAFPKLFMLQLLPPQIQQNLPGLRFAWPAYRGPSPSWEEDAIVSALSSNQAALAIIHEAPSLKSGRYTMDWNSGGGRFAAQSQAFWMISQLLQYEVLVGGKDRDWNGALDSLRRLLDLGRSLDREPALIHMRRECFDRAFIAMQWLLMNWHVTESGLRILQDEVSEASAQTDLQQTLVGQRCIGVRWYRSLSLVRPTSTGLGGPGALDMIRLQIQNHGRSWTGANERDFIAYLGAMDEFIRFAKAPWPERLHRAQRLVPANPVPVQPGSPPQLSPFSAMQVFENLIMQDAIFEARCRAALTALALERFRLSHNGRLPAKLNELVPDFISEVPSDLFDGRPIRFKKLAKGYCVYSVGRNGRDDGGTEAQPTWRTYPPTRDGDITFSVGK